MSRGVRARDVSEIALFVALSVASGIALLAVPNIELITLSVFVSGVFLGPRRGALCGALSMFLFTTFNPYGLAPFPLAVVQMGALSLAGVAGGWERVPLNALLSSGGGGPAGAVRTAGAARTAGAGLRPVAGLALLAATGVVLTVLYDFATTVTLAAMMVGSDLARLSGIPEGPQSGFWPLVIAGSAFSLVHVVSNALIFSAVGGSVVRALARWRASRPDPAGEDTGRDRG